MERGIHIFPRFREAKVIKDMRKKYDYLHDCIEPHITLVFPFKSELSSKEIVKDLKNILMNVKPFKISTNELEGIENPGYYLFLNIEEGKEIISDLHYKIHEGLLKPYQSEWTRDGSYKPHITVGRFKDTVSLQEAIEATKDFDVSYEVMVDKLFIEIIGEDESSTIEEIIELGN